MSNLGASRRKTPPGRAVARVELGERNPPRDETELIPAQSSPGRALMLESGAAVYEQVPPTALVDALPEFPRLWTRMILDGEQGLFVPPLFQEHDFGTFFNAGDLYVRGQLTSGEDITVSLARGRVLELGAGFGRISHQLRLKGMEVVTTDADPDIVAMYRSRGWTDAIEISLPEIPPSVGKFDTVIALRGVLSLTGEIDVVYRSLRRIREFLNPGGRLIFTSSKVNALLLLPGKSPLEYRIRFIYRGSRSPWLRGTALPEWLAIPFLRELGFTRIETLDGAPTEGAGYYAIATLS